MRICTVAARRLSAAPAQVVGVELALQVVGVELTLQVVGVEEVGQPISLPEATIPNCCSGVFRKKVPNGVHW